jgi:hypothetical protein
MKHFLLPAALLLAAATAQAQTAPGTWLLSGTIGYNSTKSETPATQYAPVYRVETKQFSFGPRVGYFVANNLAVGLQANVELTDNQQPYSYSFYPGQYQLGTETQRNSYFQAGPFVRYYLMVGEKAGFYGHLAGGYAKSKSTSKRDDPANTGSNNYEAQGGFADLTPGFVFFPTDKFGLELTLGNLGYSSTKGKQTDPAPSNAPETRNTSLQARFGLTQLMLGASFHLGGK